jgi:hypothetical protein
MCGTAPSRKFRVEAVKKAIDENSVSEVAKVPLGDSQASINLA